MDQQKLAQSSLPRSGCPVEQLSWYVNHTLSPEEQAAISKHLRGCADCRHDVEQWMRTETTMQLAAESLPRPRADLFAEIEQALDTRPRSATYARPQLWQRVGALCSIVGEHYWAQAQQIRIDLLWSPPLLLIISLTVIHWHIPTNPLEIQAFFSSLVAALGMAFLYSQEEDPAHEMILATRTSPGFILFVRSSIVFGYNILINLLTLLPFIVSHTATNILSPGWLLANWLAPFCCLVALSLLLSTIFNSRFALTACLILWGLRGLALLQGTYTPSLLQSYEQIWHQTPLLITVTCIATILTFMLIGRKEFHLQ